MKKTVKKSKLTPKQKKTQRTVIIVLILIVIVALYFKFRKPKDEPGVTGTTPSATGSNSSSTSSGMKRVGNDTILKYGTNAEEVKWVQSGYNSKYAVPMGMTKLVVDGKFGTKTQAAVKFATGKTTTSWTAFKAVLDNKSSATQLSQNLFYDPTESVWPWES